MLPLEMCQILVPALPLAAAAIIALLGAKLLRERSHWVLVAALALSCVCSVILLWHVRAAGQIAQPASSGVGWVATQPTDVRAAGQIAQPASPALANAGFEQITKLWTWAAIDDAAELKLQPDRLPTTASLDRGSRPFQVEIALRADSLTAIMLTMVTFISTLVTIFAGGYMHGDRGYWRFFAYVGLFVFSMTMLVSVSNFALLFVFWEAVGLCSYLLIGFWYEKPSAAAAGKKAFLVNRVGDFGFALGIFLIWTSYGTLNFHDATRDGNTDPRAVAEAVQRGLADPAAANVEVVRGVLGPWRITADDYVGGPVGVAICLLLFVGACGKSAQFPLHVWLPDAMEGPTPVSALIHAATMVTAGVYMVARCTPLFMVAPEAQLIVASVGAFTALLAGLIALTQHDLKRVLAYSTVSQLGYMFLALGTGTLAGISAAMFHLFTHAFFKALLFLGSGSVMHAMGNVIDMRRFGGLRRLLPWTYATFLIGCVSLAGVPFFSGFWSKDAILAAVHDRAHVLQEVVHHRHQAAADASGAAADGHGSAAQHADAPAVAPEVARLTSADLLNFAAVYQVLYGVALVAAALTAFYTFRAFYLTFHGEPRIPAEAGHHAHESPRSMVAPLVVLAVCAALVGVVLDRTASSVPTHHFAQFLSQTPSLAAGAVAVTRQPSEFHLEIAGLSTVVALVSILAASYLYLGGVREARWLKSLLDFDGFSRVLDADHVARLGQRPLAVKVQQAADRVGLGWLTRLAGYVVLLVVLVLAIPFLLGNFVSPYKLSQQKFFLDELYFYLLVLPLRAAARGAAIVDRWLVDAVVDGIGHAPRWAGVLLRSLQTGLVQFYAVAMVLGVLVLLATRLL